VATWKTNGHCTVAITNVAPYEVFCPRNTPLVRMERLPPAAQPTKEAHLAVMEKPREPWDADKLEAFLQQMEKQGTPLDVQQEIIEVLQQEAEISTSRTPKGFLHLKYKPVEPHYQKQTKIPEAYQDIVAQQIQQWLNLGLVRRSESMFNTPLTCISTKEGQQVVQDFRQLNQHLEKESIAFKSIQETLEPIEREQSRFFSTLDLSGPAWQLRLPPDQQEITAFSFPGLGQFQWKVAPKHLGGAEATFHRHLQQLLDNMPGVVIHVDRVVVHAPTLELHMQRLRQVLKKLRLQGLAIDLEKSQFATNQAHVLGFVVKEGTVKIHPQQIQALKNMKPPNTMALLKSFLGLSNFFRGHIRNYAELAEPLHKLAKTNSGYKGGPLPLDAAVAFKRLQNTLTSDPVVSLPRPDRQFAVIVDASTGTADCAGGIGAILTQMDSDGKFYAICYASRQLWSSELNHSPYLLEMAAAVWAIKTFANHLRGQRFILFTDH
jgi:hypothetical protein